MLQIQIFQEAPALNDSYVYMSPDPQLNQDVIASLLESIAASSRKAVDCC